MPIQKRAVIPPRRSSESDADEQTLYDPSDDNASSYDGRPSEEFSEADHDILESEDERERLLTQKEGFFQKKSVKIGKREKDNAPAPAPKKSRARKRKGKRGGSGEESASLMYEMEEGIGARSSSSSSIDSERRSSENDEKRLRVMGAQRKTRRKHIHRRGFIYIGVIAAFLILLFAAYSISQATADAKFAAAAMTMVSNGTSLFAPTTILISLDGFRADFLYRNLTPTLNKFVQEGVSPKYMLPSFPSVTFPNHYTMATGLYPEAHGVVGNSFWDPALKKDFYYTDPNRSMQPYWWGGEPLWETAERQNVRAAVHMWPGSEMHDPPFTPAYIDKYNGSEALARKVDRIMEFLDMPGPFDMSASTEQPRPQLIAAYVPNVDSDGHRYGPNSTEIRQTITNTDAMIGDILTGLKVRNLTSIVNIVIVSDHGMATTSTSRLIQLEDLVDPNELAHIDGWPHYGLRPKNLADVPRLHKQIVDRAQNMSNVEIYLRDEDMPERYHFSQNERIAPLWIIPKAGWAIVHKPEGDVEEMKKNGEVYHPRGVHGYDHEHPLMRAIFVARGPAFPHLPGSLVEPFQNTHLYNIICDSIGIEPAPNNGTLRLPLKPVGLHTDPELPSDEELADPLPSLTSSPSSSPSSPHFSASLSSPSSPPTKIPTLAPSPTQSALPAQSSSASKESWWEWLTHKADHAESWVEGFLNEHLPGKSGKGEGEGESEGAR
ncbi:Phosphodiest-domain-containing protein [Massarina eburnea CBS 473.64]|uniref:Phosphodiest-domain-containing protein n=1 Tax=Massarina eburnea CBS 473.64 TaxID=1395130 RepID=A0A6A6RRG1_9PLEO|nr:Phosphodiest-domain-containing protein [Massarina eburnea CBS 473.64]